MGAFGSRPPRPAPVPELPYRDTREHFRDRINILASANDQIYRRAYHDYISSAHISDFRELESIISRTRPPHLIMIRGDVYEKRYMIFEKFSMQRTTSTWLAADLNTYTRKTTPSCEHVLIKFARADVHYSHGIRREIQLAPIIRQGLEQARIPLSHSPLLRIHQDFRVPGIGGQQLAIIFERARCDLRSIMGQALPIVSVRLIARDMLRALDFMHRQCGIVHTDVNPSNIMLVADSTALQEGQYRDTIDEMYALEGYLFPLPVVKLCELGESSDIATPRVVTPLGSLHYRAPEVILGMHYNTAFDVWSLGCTIYEALTGAKLFDPAPFQERGLTETEAVLASYMKVLGALPATLQHLPLVQTLFDGAGRLLRYPDLELNPIRRRLWELYGFTMTEAIAIEAFLLPMLQIDPERRVEARDHLSHAWLQTALCVNHVQYRVNEQQRDVSPLEFGLRRTFSAVFD